MAGTFDHGEGPCSLVFDPGNYSMRIGYAGEGLPKSEIPSFIGVAEGEKMDHSSNNENSSKRFKIGSSSLHNMEEDIEIKTYMKDGMVDNWEMFYEVLVHSYASVLSINPNDHPVLCSEAPWNEPKNRERVAEIFFEDLQVPAFMSVKNAVLASFANGRATSIVIDSGLTYTSAVPIHDGFCLQSGIVKTPLGGSYVNEQCKKIFNNKGIQIADLSRANGDDKNAKKSYNDFLVEQMLEEFKANVLKVSDVPYSEEQASTAQKVAHKFPNGHSDSFGSERFLSVEQIFDRAELNKNLSERSLSASDAVISAISSCENDLRPSLFGSVILTGGNSLIQGFPERLSKDLSLRTPSNCKFKLISPSGPKERRLASWIGGSIVASLPSFPKMVASREEYFEYGRVNVMRKFP